jgi:hypothetical protein
LRTAKLLHSLAALLCCATLASGALFVTLEEDLRGTYVDNIEGEINSVGGSARLVIPDRAGDRWILYLQAEAASNLSHFPVHQAYAQLKGPMGLWNVALGRIPLPWGLLTAWSPDRMPYTSPYAAARINSADNGMLVYGARGAVDYGVALTQGYGMGEIQDFPGPGLVTARLGVTPLISGEYTFGLSASWGTSYHSSHGMHTGDAEKEKRTALALDGTVYAGRTTLRFEGVSRLVEKRLQNAFFAAADFALLPRLSLVSAGQIYTHGTDHTYGRLFAGIAVPIKSVTIRGGYEYERAADTGHKAILQLYRSFSFSR